MNRVVPPLVIGLLFALCAGAVFLLQDPLHYPWIVTETHVKLADRPSSAAANPTSSIKISFIGNGLKSAPSCQRQVVAMINALRTNCPSCVIHEFECLNPPSAHRRSYLSNEPADMPVALYASGVVIYESANRDLAVATCEQSEKLGGQALQMRCLPSNTPKPMSSLAGELEGLLAFTALLAAIGMLGTWAACYLILKYEHLHVRFTKDPANGGPQKIHTDPTPRVGGVALFFALILVSMVLQTLEHRYGTREFGLLLFAALPVFLIGLAEDVTKRVGVLARLAVTMLGAGIGAWLLEAALVRLDVPGLDTLLQLAPVALLLTVIAVAGVTNAFNIIDGQNGLAAGTAVIASLAMGFVAWHIGDPLVMAAAFALAGVLIGFLAWNWPHGRIFLGDGGAYLIGFWLAELAVILVVRNKDISPWFPLSILIYPVFETLVTIVRRKFGGLSPGAPDADHLHQLTYRRLQRQLALGHTRDSAQQVAPSKLNGFVALYFWLPNAALAVGATMFYTSTTALASLVLLYCVGYLLVFRSLASADR